MIRAYLAEILGILGVCGAGTLTARALVVLWQFRDYRSWSFGWHQRNAYLMQLSAIACLFFLAMTASYSILGDILEWIYLIAAFKTGTWWLRLALSRRA